MHAHCAGEATLFFSIASRGLGFTSMFLGEIPPDEKLMDDQMVHYSPDDPWPLHYSTRRFRLVDPIIPMVKSLKYDVITWDMAKEQIRKNCHAARMYREAALMGIEDGLMFVRYTQNNTIGYAQVMGAANCVQEMDSLLMLQLEALARAAITKEASFSKVVEIKRELPPLSPRMLEVLRPVIEGWTNEAIAAEFGITSGAVENIISKLYAAFGVPDHKYLNKRVTLSNRARLYGLSPIEPVLTKHKNYEISRGSPN